MQEKEILRLQITFRGWEHYKGSLSMYVHKALMQLNTVQGWKNRLLDVRLGNRVWDCES